MSLSSAGRRLAELEEQRRPQDDRTAEALSTWAGLVKWFNWTRQFTDWQAAFAALASDHPIRQLNSELTWCFRHFAPMIPESVKVAGWTDRAKLALEYCIISGLEMGIEPAELSGEGYFRASLELTIAALADWPEPAQTEAAPPKKTGCTMKPVFEPSPVIEPEPEPEPAIIPIIESIGPEAGEVTNGNIKIKLVGPGGFELMTTTGRVTVTRGVTYEISPETWVNIREFSIGKWEKVQQ